MTKDRISEMVSLMNCHTNSPVFKENVLVATQEPVPEETSRSISLFLEQVQCCREEINSMRHQIDKLKRYHIELQTSVNGITRKELEKKVEDKKIRITSTITAIRKNIKSIHGICISQKKSPAMERMKEVQIYSLLRSINNATEEYYNCLVDHSMKCKKLFHNMISIINDNELDSEELIQKGKVAFFVNNLLLNEFEEKVNLRTVEDRRADILSVEKSIEELKFLMQDLWLVVAAQSDRIDYTEQYAQKTAKKVDDAARTIEKATKMKNKTRKRKLIISLVCLIFIMIVLVVIVII